MFLCVLHQFKETNLQMFETNISSPGPYNTYMLLYLDGKCQSIHRCEDNQFPLCHCYQSTTKSLTSLIPSLDHLWALTLRQRPRLSVHLPRPPLLSLSLNTWPSNNYPIKMYFWLKTRRSTSLRAHHDWHASIIPSSVSRLLIQF